MPTATFFRLPEQKRMKLVSAIKAEFSRVPFDEVSINKIIQTAQIPRGSFYQYFSGKKDMLAFILEDYQKEMMDRIKQSLRQSGGDFFLMSEDILNFTIEFGTGEATHAFCKNLFADVRLNGGFYYDKFNFDNRKIIMEELVPNIDMELLDDRCKHDFLNIIEILMALTIEATVNAFSNLDRIEEIRQRHHEKVAILRRGLTKDKT